MKYRKLGETGLDVSALSFGASSLGSVFKPIDEGEGVRTVHTALDLGINLIDVSPYYGLTKAETVLGKALKEVPRDRYLLSTKAGRYGESEFDFSPERLASSVEESMRRLHVDYVDILLLHDIEFVPLEPIIHESIPALQRLKEQGKIRLYGISGFPLSMFEKVLAQAPVDVMLSYCHYALNNDRLNGLLPLVEEKGVGLMNASPLSMGLLSSQGPPDWHPADEEVKAACREAARCCRDNGLDLAKLAIQYAVSNEAIPTTLVGTASPANLANNVSWLEEPVDEAALAQVRRILEPVHNRTWKVGLDENNGEVAGE